MTIPEFFSIGWRCLLGLVKRDQGACIMIDWAKWQNATIILQCTGPEFGSV